MIEGKEKIEEIRFEKDFLILVVNQNQFQIQLNSVSAKLYNASPSSRNDYHISASGYGIHWPQLDEDLSLKQLLAQAKSSKLQRP